MRRKRYSPRIDGRFERLRRLLATYKGGVSIPSETPPFIAYDGRVFDVSQSFLWKNGGHQATHSAGEDLTPSLDQASHGEDLPERVPMVGILISG
jgi:predicted heme/steroid binding protein